MEAWEGLPPLIASTHTHKVMLVCECMHTFVCVRVCVCEHVNLVVFLQEVLVLLLDDQLLQGLGGLRQRCALGPSQRPMARQLVDRTHAAGHASLCRHQGRLVVHGD